MPSELSGGMIKRAGLARALALDPEILFLDEPTSGLDPIGAAAFDELIGRLRDSLGLTVYMVTHDLDSLYSVCDRIAVLAHDAGIPLSATISVAFGDPFDGEVPLAAIAELARRAAAAGPAEIALGDTIGVADPWDVRRRAEAVREAAPNARLRMHFHNTRNTALANVFAAVEAGVDVIDASVGGIGGCPFAPAATGNVATEDVVYMLEGMGMNSGVDLIELARTRVRDRTGVDLQLEVQVL